MNRVKRTSRRYLEQKSLIDRDRAVRSHTRRARRHAVKIKTAQDSIQAMLAQLPHMTKPELVEIAKGLGVPRRSRLTKPQLVKAISEVIS